jgi:hypothetical protein
MILGELSKEIVYRKEIYGNSMLGMPAFREQEIRKNQ